MAKHECPWKLQADGVLITVRLTLRSSKDQVEKIGEQSDGRPLVLARVRAAPEKGAADKAIAALFAKALAVLKLSVGVIPGSSARIKTLRVLCEPQQLVKRLEDPLS
ncbi:hypothetical protein GCM10007094_16310 [Pseudovibrio japonicus]|uniref:UPF0235 protein GCM10007094_16310 n=1 Tax=Pseudovibrio japonicus TaxID=366534 RepID=A0ABQ3E7F8_9HYPH|nr:DUF167 family protein [Pseudovibrio japonicus]GHB28509.1 hypothetical protein GCM10007094_16310 [Pseudovibrio japonicus]